MTPASQRAAGAQYQPTDTADLMLDEVVLRERRKVTICCFGMNIEDLSEQSAIITIRSRSKAFHAS